MRHAGKSSYLDTPLRRGVLLALVLGFAPSLQAGLSHETWESRDSATILREVSTGGEADQLLASTLGERDSATLLKSLRRLARLEAPDWMRMEALSALCEYFCVTENRDSLARRSAEFALLAGTPFDCPLRPAAAPAPAATGRWWLQAGAFSTEVGAKVALKSLGGKSARRVTQEGGLWKAQLGPYASRAEAARAAAALQKTGRLKEHRVVEAP